MDRRLDDAVDGVVFFSLASSEGCKPNDDCRGETETGLRRLLPLTPVVVVRSRVFGRALP